MSRDGAMKDTRIGAPENSETFYQLVIENAAGVPFKLRFGTEIGGGRYEYVGPGILDLVGLTPEQFTEQRFYSLVREVVPLLPDIPLDPLACRERMLAGKLAHYKADVRITTADGKEKWLTDRSLPLRDPLTGEVVGAQGILMDITDRKKAQKALEESERRYRELVNLSPDAIAVHSEGKIIYINPGGVKLLGATSAEQVIGMPIESIVHPDSLDGVYRRLRMMNHDGVQAPLAEEKFVRLDGRVIDVDVVAMPLNYAGKPATQVIVRDISERKEADKLQNAIYRISEAATEATSLEDLFKAVHRIVSTVMPARNFYISLYDEAADILSFPYFVDEVDSTPAPVKPRKGLTEYVLRTGKPLLCDEPTDIELRRRGEVDLIGAPSAIWIGVPLRTSDKTIGVMVVQHYRDAKAYGERELKMLEFVSLQVAKAIERKRAEARLRQSEEQFRLISENVADLIAVLDLEGRRLYNSPSYRELLGDPAQLKGTSSFEEIHPEDRDRIRQIFAETVRTGIGQRTEYRFLLPDGTVRFVESQGSVIRDAEGKISRVLVVSRDVTEKKKLERQFLRSQRMESIGTLASGIAHDLNNVLTPILMSVEVLQKKDAGKDFQRLLNIIDSSATRGSDIVRQVLAFGRGVEGERVPLQPKHIIDDIAKIARETFPRSIEIQTSIAKNLWTLSADPTQLHQVLLNIGVNARDAMPDGGMLKISAENVKIDDNYARMHLDAKTGPYVMIEVADTGEGIPAKILDKIFEPFFTTKEVGKGTGLGLSTALAIVKSHGGFINVYTEPGKGAAFKIYFPADVTSTAASPRGVSAENLTGNGELILVVDDEALIRQVTKETLESKGYRVVTANDGTEAIAVYAQRQAEIDIVVTDMMMPFMDGTVTIRALTKINPQVKVLAVSGLAQTEKTLAEFNLRSVNFLHKPYTADKLLAALRRLIQTDEAGA